MLLYGEVIYIARTIHAYFLCLKYARVFAWEILRKSMQFRKEKVMPRTKACIWVGSQGKHVKKKKSELFLLWDRYGVGCTLLLEELVLPGRHVHGTWRLFRVCIPTYHITVVHFTLPPRNNPVFRFCLHGLTQLTWCIIIYCWARRHHLSEVASIWKYNFSLYY
jgi:hypothetical protein